MRKLLAVTCALAAAACGGSAAFKEQARDAMPDSSGVAVGPQQSQTASQMNALSAQGSSQAAVAVDPWYAATVAYSVSINVATAWTLGAVSAVTATEPTSCTATSCTWGPGSNALDPNDYRLIVSQNANGSFDWHLDAQSKANAAAGFFTIITGNAVPSGQRHRGTGTFTVDLNAAKNLSGHATDQGTIVITYSNVGPAHVQASFNNFISQDAQHLGHTGNAYYNYQQDITGGGDMEIAFHDVNTNERDDIHSRWKAAGSGRADVTVLNAPNSVPPFSNCWSAAAGGFVTVYGQLSSVGSVSACSYADAAFGTHINDPQ
jgi:hypothetical protein